MTKALPKYHSDQLSEIDPRRKRYAAARGLACPHAGRAEYSLGEVRGTQQHGYKWRRARASGSDLPMEGNGAGRAHGQGSMKNPVRKKKGLTRAQRARARIKRAAKASEMAAREIDRLTDPSVSEEERQVRKRRLLRG